MQKTKIDFLKVFHDNFPLICLMKKIPSSVIQQCIQYINMETLNSWNKSEFPIIGFLIDNRCVRDRGILNFTIMIKIIKKLIGAFLGSIKIKERKTNNIKKLHFYKQPSNIINQKIVYFSCTALRIPYN